MALRPLGDRIVVKLDEVKTQTESGIYIPEQSTEVPRKGTVIECGPDVSPSIYPGVEILFSRFGGTDINVGDYHVKLFKEEDILGIWEPEQTFSSVARAES